MRLLAYCLMPNHFHLVLRPHCDGDLSHWMQWLMTTHVRRYLTHYGHSGHVWQGRFKAFPAQDDEHLVTVVRYVERNPLRAALVARAEDWPWSSLGASGANLDVVPKLASDELLRRGDWTEFVNQPMSDAEAEAIQLAILRGRPFGSETWTQETAKHLGLEFSMRSRGGQRKGKDPTQNP